LDTPVVVESFGVSALLLANVLAGVILGAGIYLGRTSDTVETGDAGSS
jgi:hypothetical protein